MIQNNLSPLPFWDELNKQHQNKWYSYGEKYGLITPLNEILPFQFERKYKGSGDGYVYESDFSKNIDSWNVRTGSPDSCTLTVQNDSLQIPNTTGSAKVIWIENTLVNAGLTTNKECYVRIKAKNGTLNYIEDNNNEEITSTNKTFDRDGIIVSAYGYQGLHLSIYVPANTTMIINYIHIIEKSVNGETTIYQSRFSDDDTTEGWSIVADSGGLATLDSNGKNYLHLDTEADGAVVKIGKTIDSGWSNNFYLEIVASDGILSEIVIGDYSASPNHNFLENNIYRINIVGSYNYGTTFTMEFEGDDIEIDISRIAVTYSEYSVNVVEYATGSETDITSQLEINKTYQYDYLKYIYAGNNVLNNVTDLGYWYVVIQEGDIYSYSELFNVNSKKESVADEYYISSIENSGGRNTSDWEDTGGISGLADGWGRTTSGDTPSIVTGNGFTGNAQRQEMTDNTINSDMAIFRAISIVAQYNTEFRFKYRSGKTTQVIFTATSGTFTYNIPLNTGDALEYTINLDAIAGDASVNEITEVKFEQYALDNGDYYEVDELEIWYYAAASSEAEQDLTGLIKLEFWNETDLVYNGGEISYDDNYKHRLYLCTDIGKPNYETEEEITRIEGINYPEKIISYKLFRFDFLAPEFMTDLLRIARLHDYVTITNDDGIYEITSINFEPEWQEQGDLANELCEFETDTVIKNVGKVI